MSKSSRILIFAVLTVCAAGPLHAQVEKYDGRDVLPGRLIVSFAPGTRQNAATFLNIRNYRIRKALRHTPYEIWEYPKGLTVERAMQIAQNIPGIQAEPDYVLRTAETDDPYLVNQWALPQMQVFDAWLLAPPAEPVIVAIIDSGVRWGHADLAANIYYNPNETLDGTDTDGNGYIDDIRGWDFAGPVLSPLQPDNDPYDYMNHGTPVSGIIGAVINNGVGIAGIAQDVRLMALKVGSDEVGSTSLSTAAAAEAIDYAIMQGAKVINASWSGDFSRPIKDGIQAAGEAGIIFVAAAGNDGANLETSPEYPTSNNLSTVISLAATTSTDTRPGWSNYSIRTVHLGAPGDTIYTTSGNSYANKSGTSFAAPQISGIAALILSRRPNLTPRQIKLMIKEGVDTVPSMQGTTVTGGRANAYKAITTPVPFILSRHNILQSPKAFKSKQQYSPATDTITIAENVRIRTLSVRVEATHSRIGNVQIILESPQGTQCTLKKPDSATGANIAFDYGTYYSFRDELSAGQWTLTISDESNPPATTGYLTAWGIEILYSLAEDINGDGCVDIADLIAVRNALGQTTGSADVNNDAIIDLIDLVRVRNRLGICAN